MSHAGGHATLPGTPSRMGTGGSSLNMTAVIRAVDLESKSVDKRGASAVLGVGSKRAGRGGGDMVDSKQEPSQKPLQAPASLEASTETYTKLTSSLRRNSDYTLSFALIGVLCMMVQVRCRVLLCHVRYPHPLPRSSHTPACLPCLQNELAWVWNTEAGYGSFCPSDTPDCSADVKRARAAMFPVTEGLVVLNALRAVITFTTLVCRTFHTPPGGGVAAAVWYARSRVAASLRLTVHAPPPRGSSSHCTSLLLLQVLRDAVDSHEEQKPVASLRDAAWLRAALAVLVRVDRAGRPRLPRH